MRLPDLINRKPEEELSPEAARELEAIDRALAGAPVDPDLADLATLAAELREQRPEPSLSLEQELERLRERGFRREGRRRWLEPRTYLAPAAGLATLAVIATVVVSVQSGPDDGLLDGRTTEREAAGEDRGAATEALSPVGEGAAAPPAGEGAAVPTQPKAALDADAAPLEGLRDQTGERRLDSLAGNADRHARNAERRQQDRAANVALRTDVEGTREVSNRVIQITRTAGGVVVSSSLSEDPERSTADLQLQIPTRELDSALGQITDLATVRSLNEASRDITRPFVSARDRLADARAKRRQLLEALGNAQTEIEAEALQRQIDRARRQIARAEARFERIARQARLSDVAVIIEGVPGGDGDGSWSLGDAADDALEALKTVLGVMLIAAAIIVPVGLLLAAIAYAGLGLRRRRREAALD